MNKAFPKIRIFTSSWFAKLPPGYLRIGVSRSVPRNIGGGYRRLKELQPGPCLNDPPKLFALKYGDQLDGIDPAALIQKIETMADGYVAAVLCCYESPTGSSWCHRSLVSAWLEHELGISVPEFGHCGCGRHPLRYRG